MGQIINIVIHAKKFKKSGDATTPAANSNDATNSNDANNSATTTDASNN